MPSTSLHLLRSSPFTNQQAKLMLTLIGEKDTVVLMDDGCYLNAHPLLTDVLAKTTNVYFIGDHLMARALTANSKIGNINLAQLTALIFTHSNSVTWQ